MTFDKLKPKIIEMTSIITILIVEKIFKICQFLKKRD